MTDSSKNTPSKSTPSKTPLSNITPSKTRPSSTTPSKKPSSKKTTPKGATPKKHPRLEQFLEAPTPGQRISWHPTSIDLSSFASVNNIRKRYSEFERRYIDEATCPQFSTTVLAKWIPDGPYGLAEHDTLMLDPIDKEALAYQWLDGTGVGPKFLGHITNRGAVIGFLVENVAHIRTAEPADLPACRKALRALHEQGIKHGDITKFNFLVGAGEQGVTIVDFEYASMCTTKKELEQEMSDVLDALEDTSGGGGPEPEGGWA